MGILEKIADIEAEMARTQKNKATGLYLLKHDGHVNLISRRISRWTVAWQACKTPQPIARTTKSFCKG